MNLKTITKMKGKVKAQFSWFEVILDDEVKLTFLATSMLNAMNIANDTFGEEWKYVATV